MTLNRLIVTMDAEVVAAQRRASDQSKAIRFLLAAGSDSSAAERALFRELDGLALLRERQRMMHALRHQPFQNEVTALDRDRRTVRH